MTRFAAVLLVAAAVFATPAVAQDAVSATLQVESGSVMTSTGGEYASANSGQSLAAGQKVMVNAGSSGFLAYGNGCKIKLDQPGVYTVPSSCNAVPGKAGGSSTMNAGIIAISALVAAGLIENEDATPNGPLSTGIRHF